MGKSLFPGKPLFPEEFFASGGIFACRRNLCLPGKSLLLEESLLPGISLLPEESLLQGESVLLVGVSASRETLCFQWKSLLLGYTLCLEGA